MIRAATASISTPVSASLPARASGQRAKNRPVPQPGSRTRPPSKPIRRSVRQMARIMNSGVWWAYWAARLRLARSSRETSPSSSTPRSSQAGAKASPARWKIRSARSDAPNAVSASRSCSSGRAWRASASIVVMSRIAARLSSARAFQPSARQRSPASRERPAKRLDRPNPCGGGRLCGIGLFQSCFMASHRPLFFHPG